MVYAVSRAIMHIRRKFILCGLAKHLKGTTLCRWSACKGNRKFTARCRMKTSADNQNRATWQHASRMKHSLTGTATPKPRS